ncbi:Zinc finger CCCH domain-containing protein 39 [Acorus calamus]|uniref:Zinc finger CCCH domain-containing protein 39 n=1 Tax=Acorus calamus TaxID=4465 RepID=A0AAV9E2E4_ACOCL|nr:Zinc finger CCCH domain-containing protein 39 [Acorus calamus]
MRRPRDCDETIDNSLAKRPHIQPILPTPPPPPPPPPHNNGHYNNGRVNKLFYKTRLCQKFSAGNCPYGNSCNFAHGSNDLRVPPSNWKDIITHPDNISKNLSEKPGVLPKGLCHRPNESLVVEVNKDSRESESNWEKKGPCFKWETTGYCLYGDRCQFVHFPRDPTKFRSRYAKAEHGHPHAAVAPLKSPQGVPSNASPPSTAAANPFCKMKAEEKKLFLINKGHKKINGVYGDWIKDDSQS